MLDEIVKTIIYLVSFVIVIILAFYFTKFIAKKSNLMSRSKNIKVIEAISLGNNTRIFIVEVLGIIYIVFDNNSHLLLLDKLNRDDVDVQFRDIEIDKDNFKNIIEKLTKSKDSTNEMLSNKRKDK
ncbi:flagellar biosynthetic protein FliO [Proteiniborus sp.]|uniref:flagellar biosynthetic protein FliO n=1 Tax=Proteiniborus sp. TaxID=2079015 RepID=UPI0033220376